MSDFVKTMRDWKRMCDAFSKQYGEDSCKYCPLDHYKSCGAIWEIEEDTYGNIAKTVDAWAEEHPEPQYPTWAEWLKSVGVLPVDQTLFHTGLKQPIPADIAEKLGLEPKGGNEND